MDPLLHNDPWAEAVRERRAPAGAGPSGANEAVQVMKAQVESSVLAKVKQAQVSQVDLGGLTNTVEQVHSLEGTVSEVAHKVDRQEQSMRELFLEQMTKIEDLFGRQTPAPGMTRDWLLPLRSSDSCWRWAYLPVGFGPALDFAFVWTHPALSPLPEKRG